MSVKNVTFHSFSLQDDNWRTKDVVYRNLPQKVLNLEPLSRRDGFRFVSSFYSDKEITISGSVTADTEAALKILVDNMKSALHSNESNLDIDDGGTTTRWVASVSRINVPEEHYHITRVPFEISFTCQPFGKLTTATTDTNSIVNTSSLSDSVVIAGSAPARPVIRWTVSGSPSAAITAISFTNSSLGDVIAVTGLSLSGDGDYLEIDTENMSVVQNTGSGEVELDFTGVFPRFAAGTNAYSVAVTGGGATRTLNQLLTYYQSYL